MSIIVNPSFRLDVTGQLFRNKDSNINVQDTLLFNKLFTRLGIVKGEVASFPELGLKQHLFNLNYNDRDTMEEYISAFESDASDQLNQNCTIASEYTTNDKNVSLEFTLENLKYSIEFEYQNLNKSIKIINYQFSDKT